MLAAASQACPVLTIVTPWQGNLAEILASLRVGTKGGPSPAELILDASLIGDQGS